MKLALCFEPEGCSAPLAGLANMWQLAFVCDSFGPGVSCAWKSPVWVGICVARLGVFVVVSGISLANDVWSSGIALGILVGPVVGAVISNQGFVAACRTLAKQKALLHPYASKSIVQAVLLFLQCGSAKHLLG